MNTRIVFLCALVSTAIGMQTVHAATITVQNTGDGPANAANCPGPGCRLRDAVEAARNGDTIDFSVTGTIAVDRDGFILRKSITISGPGAANLTIRGARSAVFFVGLDLTVTISGLTITNGAGGGIINERAALRVFDCVFSNNDAENGGAISNAARYGHGATLIVSGCTFRNNSALFGGAISNDGHGDDATVRVTFSTFDHNTAKRAGGGIWNTSVMANRAHAAVTVSNSTFSRNVAGELGVPGHGGGICNDAGAGSATMQIINSTFSDNSITRFGDGGGIYNTGESVSATLSVNNSTFSGNTAGGGGGSIHNFGMRAIATLSSTIFNGQGPSIQNQRGIVTSRGYNLSSDNGGGVLTAFGDRILTNPLLGPLQNNGGPTDTHALLSGSRAIDAGDPHFDPNAFDPPLTDDQRGASYARVVNARIDIGAFEEQIPP